MKIAYDTEQISRRAPRRDADDRVDSKSAKDNDVEDMAADDEKLLMGHKMGLDAPQRASKHEHPGVLEPTHSVHTAGGYSVEHPDDLEPTHPVHTVDSYPVEQMPPLATAHPSKPALAQRPQWQHSTSELGAEAVRAAVMRNAGLLTGVGTVTEKGAALVFDTTAPAALPTSVIATRTVAVQSTVSHAPNMFLAPTTSALTVVVVPAASVVSTVSSAAATALVASATSVATAASAVSSVAAVASAVSSASAAATATPSMAHTATSAASAAAPSTASIASLPESQPQSQSPHSEPATAQTQTIPMSTAESAVAHASSEAKVELPPPLIQSMPPEQASATASSAGAPGRAAEDGGPHSAPTHRLSDGYVILISIAVMFVCATMFYYYIRRHKRAKNGAGNAGRRSILSSHSGMPSAGDEDEDKHFCSGPHHHNHNHNHHLRNMPDSGTSIDYPGKTASNAAGKRLPGTAGNADVHSERLVRLQVPAAGTHDSEAPTRGLSGSYYNYRVHDTATPSSNYTAANGGSGGHPRMPAKSDIYDCVQTGKGHGNQPIITHTFLDSHPAGLALAAVKRGSISLDQVNIRTPPAVAMRGDSSAHALTGLCPRVGAGAGVAAAAAAAAVAAAAGGSGGVPIPNFPLPPSGMDGGRSLLDTTSANPGIRAAGEGGAKTKPRKLVRIPSKQPARGGRQTGEAGDRITITGSPSKAAAAAAQEQPSPRPGSSPSPGFSPPPAAPQWDAPLEPPAPGAQPKAQANFLSLHDSAESLSDNYQFAVRHEPPLGPLRAVEAHMPTLPDELRIRRGDEVRVLGEFADGWVMAINASRANECGMIPRRCLFFPAAPFMTQQAVGESAPLAAQPLLLQN
ncbi:hypothetical protein H4R18_001892 [Coemansia javaensis]|uniref:SH3 domain-containing protein n=1 Tax=Coemansia javaensis TaxID=2761396 RepID=A0A9W8HDI4_9FUNG|nr:hypothetical protein H4R18_001892 [Coemansia javaensis]